MAAGVADDFNRANNASSLGTSSSGALWTTRQGVGGISSNQAYFPTSSGGTPGMATVDAARSDGTVQTTIATLSGSTRVGVVVRYVDVSNYIYFAATTTSCFFIRVLGGSNTTLGTGAAFANGDVLSVVLTGTGISARKNGAALVTTTDSNFLTSTLHGIYAQGSAVRLDDFSVG